MKSEKKSSSKNSVRVLVIKTCSYGKKTYKIFCFYSVSAEIANKMFADHVAKPTDR